MPSTLLMLIFHKAYTIRSIDLFERLAVGFIIMSGNFDIEVIIKPIQELRSIEFSERITNGYFGGK